ncbi:type I restriction enzyme HsdR N-terminal domain-containing protein [Polyangium aurulentum]|uniref:type I restriction enzyme HsdR N-terminal domain-containing protein n=1 Tax=Polyangium aurulentum TaxID=2567896 RepID=UPI00146DA0B2|nr:type I restriction enzyme HsdR N-terminal domain-containing protein [Polyangium aurulentum]UQA59960.1 type I restriction enzyme HsdR N-terminal domain-containing protein [Polyangium aurulentum]
MDLVRILRQRLEALPPGDHLIGLRAVLQHVEVATKHFFRGNESGDDTAYTDAIYRTNQAFEGSLKEAYRVLAVKDPEKVRPFDIEKYLEDNSTLRQRVRVQLTRYRTEWRNPSTHDYKLDFDDAEALLAIVSVCALAVVLIDEIVEKLAEDAAKKDAPRELSRHPDRSLLDEVAEVLLHLQIPDTHAPRILEAAVIGALVGHLRTMFPDASVNSEVALTSDTRTNRVDILVERKDARVLVEVKRSGRANADAGVAQVMRYMAASGATDAVVFLFSETLGVEMTREDRRVDAGRIVVIQPRHE